MRRITIRPSSLRQDGLIIRPQELGDNDSDYAAVMANRSWLRRWSGSPWPEDSFSADENRNDLKMHIEEHQAGEALGYSILAEESSQVVGSLYLQELSELLDDYAASAEDRGVLSGCELRVDLWTRLDSDPDLLRRAVAAASTWLRPYAHPLAFCARSDSPELEDAYAHAGLRLLVELRHPESPRIHRVFG